MPINHHVLILIVLLIIITSLVIGIKVRVGKWSKYVEVKAQSISAEVKHNHAHLLPRLPIDYISIVELGLALQQRSSKCAYMSPGQVCTFQFLLASE